MKNDYISNYLDLILLNELNKKSLHAYALIKNLRDMLNDDNIIKDSSIYNALKRFEKQELILGYNEAQKNGRKRYIYNITDLGKQELLELKTNWLETKKKIDSIIEEGNYDY